MSPRNYRTHFLSKTFSFQNPYTAKKRCGERSKNWPLLYINHLTKPSVTIGIEFYVGLEFPPL